MAVSREPLNDNTKVVVETESFNQGYVDYHRRRINHTLSKLKEIGASKIIEVGSHPWAMTAAIIDEPSFEICATVSAEEVTNWPDDIGVTTALYELRTAKGSRATFTNYSANIERTLFDIPELADTVVASEIIEHLTRSPHVMLLNINRWLPVGGQLFITTPNGAQFSNPLRRRSPTADYRCNTYERHSYVFTLAGLTELVSLCGFTIKEAGYWDVIKRQGPSAVYGWLSQLPFDYFQQKFKKTLYLVAEKNRDILELERCPRVYDSRGNWEYISRANGNSR